MTAIQANPLPQDLDQALMVGRVWRSAPTNGPAVVAVRNGRVIDITRHVPTVSELLERDDLVAIVRGAEGEDLGDVNALVAAALAGDEGNAVRLLAPCDLQAIKACGVTFAVSLLERVIEEQAK
jgi:fumarylacetoacetate (FAA) hydrolase family protein